MSDPTAGRPGEPETPDFLDRLLARHVPAAASRTDVARVTPRLPGPFERVEAVRGGDADQDGREHLWPVTAPPAERRDDAATPTAREVLRTQHERTVVRTEPASTTEPVASRPTAPPASEVPLLRPVTPLTPGPRPVPDVGRRTAGRGRNGRAPVPSAVPVPGPTNPEPAPGATGQSTPRPSAADTAAARDAVRHTSARRTGRGAEQVVQVQIGRLEVTAEPAGAPARPRTRETGRPQTTVSLADYLARGRE